MRHYYVFPLLDKKECKSLVKKIKKLHWSFAWQKHFTSSVRLQQYSRYFDETLQTHLQANVLSRYNNNIAEFPINWFLPYVEVHKFSPGTWQDYHREYHPLQEQKESAKSVTLILKVNADHQSKILLKSGEVAVACGSGIMIPAFDEFAITDPLVGNSFFIVLNGMRYTKNYKSN